MLNVRLGLERMKRGTSSMVLVSTIESFTSGLNVCRVVRPF